MFKKVRTTLGKQTGGKQIPLELSSLQGDFFFVPESERKGAPVREETAGTTTATDILDEESRKLDEEQRRLEKEKTALEQQKVLDEKRRQLEEEKERLEAEKVAQHPEALRSNRTAASLPMIMARSWIRGRT